VTCAAIGLGLVDAQLGKNLVDIGVGLDVEIHEQLNDAIVGADRVHIDHVVDAIHLLLNRRRYRLGTVLASAPGRWQ